jgi:hypothetical protein
MVLPWYFPFKDGVPARGSSWQEVSDLGGSYLNLTVLNCLIIYSLNIALPLWFIFVKYFSVGFNHLLFELMCISLWCGTLSNSGN